MSFQLGDSVRFAHRKEFGVGRIVDSQFLFGQKFYDVFFPECKELVRVEQADLLAEERPTHQQVVYEPPSQFLARFYAHQIRSMFAEEGVISANHFRITPLPHQILTVDQVLSNAKPRSLIADEVGLGKTVEGAMVYEELKMRGLIKRILIVVPSGLTLQWKEELQQKFDEEFVLYNREVFRSMQAVYGSQANLWQQHDQIITSIDFIKPKVISERLSKKERARREEHNQTVYQAAIEAGFDLVIVDEAHKLSKAKDGAETARFKIGKALSEVSPSLLLLSATPHQGDEKRFLHLLSLLDPYSFSSVEDLQADKIAEFVVRNKKRAVVDHAGQRIFKQRITTVYPVSREGWEFAIERDLYDKVTAYVRENYNLAMQEKNTAFGFLMILYQRLVTSSSAAILHALESRQQKLQAASPVKKQSAQEPDFDLEEAYDENAQEVLQHLAEQDMRGSDWQTELLLLDDLIATAKKSVYNRRDAKLLALFHIVEEVCQREGNVDTKFLIFTEFVTTQKYIADALSDFGYEVVLLNGQMSTEEKQAARVAFRDRAQFLISTDAGGEGINLQFCHVMINYDLPWNPMKVEQRIGRLDRIGQEHHVLVFHLVMEDTVEDRIREILEDKLQLIKEQYGDDKLADILSTLQDDFQFDKIFIDALVKREQEAQELEALAQQIYERAKEILDKDNYLLPQTLQAKADFQHKLVQESSHKVRGLLQAYLLNHGLSMQRVGGLQNVYRFDLPADLSAKRHFAKVVFERQMAVEEDQWEFLHVNHPVVQEILASMPDGPPIFSSLSIRTARSDWSNLQGYWGLYRLTLKNQENESKEKLLSVFVTADGVPRTDVGQWLLGIAWEDVQEGTRSELDLTDVLARLQQQAERQAEQVYVEEKWLLSEKLQKERDKMMRFYDQQIKKAERIAIENIQAAQLRTIQQRKQEQILTFGRRGKLIPHLEELLFAVVKLEGSP